MPEYHGWTHRPREQGGTDPIPGLSTGLSFCYAQKSATSSGSVSSSSFAVANYGASTTFKTNDSTIFPSIYHDTGKTPEYGIRLLANYLYRVENWVWIAGDIADGAHAVSWIIDGAYTVSHFGIADSSDFTSSAASATGLADDRSAPEALYHVAYMGDTADFTVGTYHDWQGFTTDPIFFQYGIAVTLLGDLPV